jgi:saccharopine dehydrogenase-like NADP-dependent oxidoreductase
MSRFSEPEVFDLKSPFGRKKVFLVGQEEIGTLPLYVKTKNADIKIYDSQWEITGFLVKLGLTSDKKADVGGFKISPAAFLSKLLMNDEKLLPKKLDIKNAQFGFAVIAEGKKKGKRKRVAYYVAFPEEEDIDEMKIDANFISYPTALMVKFFVMAMPHVKKFGVFPPEALNEEIRKSILAGIKKEGIPIRMSE